MRDPHIHVEKALIFSHAFVRELISDTLGLATSSPKTVTTGCGRRRAYAMTSVKPETVTCLACREFAQQTHTVLATASETAVEMHGQGSPPWELTETQISELRDHAKKHREIAAQFAQH